MYIILMQFCGYTHVLCVCLSLYLWVPQSACVHIYISTNISHYVLDIYFVTNICIDFFINNVILYICTNVIPSQINCISYFKALMKL